MSNRENALQVAVGLEMTRLQGGGHSTARSCEQIVQYARHYQAYLDEDNAADEVWVVTSPAAVVGVFATAYDAEAVANSDDTVTGPLAVLVSNAEDPDAPTGDDTFES